MHVLYVTVDPQRDDVERMRTYLAAFDATFVGGTGSAEQLAAVCKLYGIDATRKTFGTTYLYAHSSFTYLIDDAGKLRALMPYGHSAGCDGLGGIYPDHVCFQGSIVRDSERHVGAPDVGEQARKPARGNPADARS